MQEPDTPPTVTFRPGALLGVAGERSRGTWQIVAGQVEELANHRHVGMRQVGDVVPRVERGVVQTTARAVSVVQARFVAS